MPRRVAILLVLVATLAIGAQAGRFSVSFTGNSIGSTPEEMGVGLGHAAESAFTWLEYLKPTAVRVFVTSINNWRNLIDSRGDEWGRSFSGADVSSEAAWRAAVTALRGVSSSPNDPDFQEWLAADDSIRWSSYFGSLQETSEAPLLRCLGSPQRSLEALNNLGIRILAVWHVTCKNLPLSTSDTKQAEYWRQRWELYRWFYAGGRFLADASVHDVELYNEPDLDLAAGHCLTSSAWLDEYKLRSLALQQAYADHAAWSGKPAPLSLSGPPSSSPKYLPGTPGKVAVQNIHEIFPSGSSASWANMNSYSYHQYNSPGYGMRSASLKLAASVKADGGGMALPLRVTEHSCYSDSLAQASVGVDVMDRAATGACVVGQAAALLGLVEWSSLQKATQTPSNKPSGVVKNGIMWGDDGAGGDSTDPGFCAVGGTTKAGEAYRMVLQRTPGRQKLYGMTTTPVMRGTTNFSMYTVASPLAYHVYSANYDKVSQSLAFSFARLPGVPAGALAVLSAVTNALHNEVSSLPVLSTSKSVTLTQPASSTYMLTVPRVPVAVLVLQPTDDTTLAAGANSNSAAGGAAAALTVQTSTVSDQDTTRVALLRFDASALPPAAKIVAAVLQLTLTESTGSTPQILTVLGTPAQWDQASATWSGLDTLLLPQPSGRGVASIAANFINYGTHGDGDHPSIVGALTAPPGGKAGTVLSLDVTDYVTGGGGSFAVARLWRFDARGSGAAKLSGDSISGRVSFASSEAAAGKPALRVIYASG